MRAVRIFFVGIAFAAALVIGESYISRLPDHRGFFLVAVDDVVRAPVPERPRSAVVVVVDGLREDFARRMRALQMLEKSGQCRTTDVGPISVSRPVYAVLSTGLEQDRTGARNNDETSPLAAESIWDVAREAGLTVQAASALPWWRELFPGGFDAYGEQLRPVSSFALSLWHPLYVDAEGHEAGAASERYRAAVERADTELLALFETLDLDRDLVVVTADHGHSDRGGHGGPDPEIRLVLTCFAGRGIAADAALNEGGERGVARARLDVARSSGDGASRGAISTRMIAPALSVLLGLRFPKHMRAGEDELDAIFELADPAVYSAEYLRDRRAAVERFRAENQRAIGGPWSALYAAEHAKQTWRAAGFALLMSALAFVSFRRRALTPRQIAFLIVWTAGIAALTVVLHVLVRGTFDWTAINIRERYLNTVVPICAGAAVLGLLVHFAIHRDVRRMADDQLTVLALALALSAGVPIAVGWRLGFPLPGPVWLLYPFVGSIALASHAVIALLLELALLIVSVVRSKRAR